MPGVDPAPDPPRLVLVAGAGRSGTSTLTGVLQRLGAHVPQPEVRPDESNPKGFGESQWVVDFHDDLLRHANVQVSDGRPAAWASTAAFAERPGATGRLSSWLAEELASSPTLVIKDPRLAWFLPLWTAVAARVGVTPSFVTMLRPPAEVVGSKRSNYNTGLQDAQGAAAWVNMMLGTEHATRGGLRTFVRYHDLLDDWRPVLAHVQETLLLPRTADDDSRLGEIDAFVDPGLRRHRSDWDDLDLPDRLAGLTRETWRLLDALAHPGAADDAPLRAELDAVRERYAAYYLEAETVSRSSAIAARRPTRPQRPGPDPAPTAPTSDRRVARRLLAGLHRLPGPVRRRVPAGLRARLAARLGGTH